MKKAKAICILIFAFLIVGCAKKQDIESAKENIESKESEAIVRIEVWKNINGERISVEYTENDDIREISAIIKNSIKEEVKKEVESTGGRVLNITFYYGDGSNISISPYSDDILHIGKKYYYYDIEIFKTINQF